MTVSRATGRLGREMHSRVTVEVAEHIARVTLNRPDKHNALDRSMFEALIEAGEALATDRSLRAVILSGAGENFCAGIDLSVFSAGGGRVFGAADMAPRAGSGANLFQDAALVWRRLPVPVIAAVRGVAFGAGLQVALGADLRLAAADSRWSIMEVRWGIVPDMGITVTSRGLLAPDRLKRLAYTGAVIDGLEAQALGLVSEIHEQPVDAATTLARELAKRSPDALRAMKSLFDGALSEQDMRGLRREATFQAALIGSPNQLEAVSANRDGRAAQFSDPDT